MRSGYLPLALSLRDTVSQQDTWNSQLNHITTALNPADKRRWFEATLAIGRPHTFAAVRLALERAFGSQRQKLRAMSERLSLETRSIEYALSRDEESLARLFAALENEASEEAEVLRNELVERGIGGRQRLAELERRVSANLEGLLSQARERELRAVRVFVVSAVFTVALGLVVAFWARRLLAPLAAVTRRAEAVAGGDLTPQVVSAGQDEIGTLATTFETMVAAIARANAKLLQSERLATIGKMAAQVTHEVRNPLSSLALNVELLEEELTGDPAEAQASIKAIKLEVARLGRLTEKYLSLARSRPNLQEEDLGQIARESLSSVAAGLREQGIEAELEIEEPQPLVSVDEAQFRQVLLNLMRNAQEAMPEGGALKLAVRREEGALTVQLSDTGVGMDAETQGRLFEPFFTTKGHGTGLGLAITREIVEAHGGTIRCELNRPRGTTFVVHLPLDRRPSHPLLVDLPPSKVEAFRGA